MIHPKTLAAALRDPRQWPPGHQWNFYNNCTCAMRIVQYMADPKDTSEPDLKLTAHLLNIPREKAYPIFVGRGIEFHGVVTPEDVARDLEALEV